VLTNTAAHGPQRGPGMQFIPTMEQVISKAARQLGIDQVAIHRINAPVGKAQVGPVYRDGSRRYVTMSNVQQALDKGAELFKWQERKQRAGKREGSKVRGIGVAVGTFVAGTMGYDGLLVIKPDGKLYIQSGVGHLGTNSTYDTCRAAAEVLGMPWEKVVITQGNSSKYLPWSCSQGGSATTHAHTRANWAAGLDAKQKLQEIAAQDLGGRPEDYDVGNERVYRKDTPARGLTFAQAAARAVALGAKYDGHQVPPDVNGMTKWSATGLAGLGLMGVAKDNFPRDGDTWSFLAGFAEVEVDLETGAVHVTDYVAVADCGTVLHPRNCQGQAFGGTMLGLSHGLYHRNVYDARFGVSLSTRFYHYKPATILDAPSFQFAALDIPDPQTPVGARGIGEPPVPAAYGAVLNALIDAIGEEAFRRAPVTPDIILASLEAGGKRVHDPLASHV
jgi:xanthine dehydrogenase molybdenum-binding subunit